MRKTIVVILFLVVPALFFNYSTVEEDKYFLRHYRIYAFSIPEQLDFSGEEVPLEDFDVRERLDREFLVSTYWQSNTLLLCKRTHRWFPVIEPVLKKEGVPDDFKYLAVVESGLMNTVSPKKARGFWQFLEGTAENYGLQVNEEIDERNHVEKSTLAACRYLKDAYRELGSWTLAAASFNMGVSGLAQQINRQKVSSYYDLYLNDETSRYVFRVLAAKEIIGTPENYGFHLPKKSLYLPFQTTTVTADSTIADLAAFARKNNVSYRIFKIFNPWLVGNSLTIPEGDKFLFNIPEPGSIDYVMSLQELTADSPAYHKEVQLLAVPKDSLIIR